MNRYYSYGEIHDEIERPDPEIIERFRVLTVAQIAKALNGRGLLHEEIKPIDNDVRICGPAVTLYGRQGDANMYQGVPDSVKPGDVIVADAAGTKTLSVCGERVAYNLCRLYHAGGMVIDGAIRDKAGMQEYGIPIFFRGIDPKLFGATGPGAINTRIQCGGVLVEPGDIVVGDKDGVIVVRRSEAELVLEKVGTLHE